MLSTPICAAIPCAWSSAWFVSSDVARRWRLTVSGTPERDDQDDEDVREREDEPGPDLRGRLLGLGIRTEPEAHPAD